MISIFFDKCQELDLKTQKRDIGLEEYQKHEYRKLKK